jgi:hypothetical protein
MYARHLPPCAGLPHVLALDPAAAAELAGLAHITIPGDVDLQNTVGAPFDAVAGDASPEAVASLAQLLRPGGRLILTASAAPEPLLAALTNAGLIHCLVETCAARTLYRGERPPSGAPVERHARLAAAVAGAPPPLALISPAELTQGFIFVLVTQTPNKPAWKLSPDDRLEWSAATLRHPATNEAAVLAFSGLVKAVAFMQSAVLTGTIRDVNKVGKFPAEAARAWGRPVLLNPDFAAVRGFDAGPSLPVDPGAAITGEE